MTLKRCLLEMGMGVDLHGRDYTSSAAKAVRDALWHNSVTFPRVFGSGPDSMHVEVIIGSPKPEAVDGDTVLKVLPYGIKSIKVQSGGLEIPSEDGTDTTVITNAAVLVSLDA